MINPASKLWNFIAIYKVPTLPLTKQFYPRET